MTKNELERTINEMNQKIISVEDLQSKLQNAEEILNKLNENITTVNNNTENIVNFNNSIQQIAKDLEDKKTTIDNTLNTTSDYGNKIETQNEEFETFKDKFNNLLKNNEELEESIKAQLGFVSMEILANAFSDEATKLKISTQKWFWWLFGSMLVLFICILSIAIWQISAEDTLFKISFLIRLPLITPVVYFLIFVAHQYNNDKKLLDEYIFKTSIARSFEAYRKVISEEDGASTDENKKIMTFCLDTIKNIYSSPMENINKYKKADDDEDDITLFNKFADIIKKVLIK